MGTNVPASSSGVSPAQSALLTYIGNRWENAQHGVLNAIIPNLTWKYAPIGMLQTGGRVALATFTNDANAPGGGFGSTAAGTANNYQQLSGTIYTLMRTNHWAFSFLGKLPIPSGSNDQEFGFVSTAGTSYVSFSSQIGVDATHMVCMLGGAGVSNVVTSHVIDGNQHTYSGTFDGTTVTFYVDNVAVGNTTTLTHLTDGNRQIYVYDNTLAGATYVTDVLYGY